MDVMIVEDFLDSQTCEELRSEASVYCPKEIGINIHGGRNFIPFSSFYFNVLLQRSVAWKTLNNRLQSQEFLDWLVAELAPDGCDQDLRATTCYGKRRSKLTNCIQEESRIRTTSNFLSFRGGKVTKVTFSILIRLSAYLMEVRRHLSIGTIDLEEQRLLSSFTTTPERVMAIFGRFTVIVMSDVTSSFFTLINWMKWRREAIYKCSNSRNLQRASQLGLRKRNVFL